MTLVDNIATLNLLVQIFVIYNIVGFTIVFILEHYDNLMGLRRKKL